MGNFAVVVGNYERGENEVMLGNTCAAILVVPWHAWCRSAPWPALLCPVPTCQVGGPGPSKGLGCPVLSGTGVCVECGGKVGMEGAHLGIASPLCRGGVDPVNSYT